MRFLDNMYLKSNPMSNTHHNYVFLDVDLMVNSSFTDDKEDSNSINNSFLLEDTFVSLDGEIYRRVEDLVCE